MSGEAEGERGSGHVAAGAGSALAQPGVLVTWPRAAWAATGSAAGPGWSRCLVPLSRNGRPSSSPAVEARPGSSRERVPPAGVLLANGGASAAEGWENSGLLRSVL